MPVKLPISREGFAGNFIDFLIRDDLNELAIYNNFSWPDAALELVLQSSNETPLIVSSYGGIVPNNQGTEVIEYTCEDVLDPQFKCVVKKQYKLPSGTIEVAYAR